MRGRSASLRIPGGLFLSPWAAPRRSHSCSCVSGSRWLIKICKAQNSRITKWKAFLSQKRRDA